MVLHEHNKKRKKLFKNCIIVSDPPSANYTTIHSRPNMLIRQDTSIIVGRWTCKIMSRAVLFLAVCPLLLPTTTTTGSPANSSANGCLYNCGDLDCVAASTDCCQSLVLGFQLHGWSFQKVYGSTCQSYKTNREMKGDLPLEVTFNCIGWRCQCPNIEEKLSAKYQELSQVAADKQCSTAASYLTYYVIIVIVIIVIVVIITIISLITYLVAYKKKRTTTPGEIPSPLEPNPTP